MNPLESVDLFSGGGGTSEGLYQAAKAIEASVKTCRYRLLLGE